MNKLEISDLKVGMHVEDTAGNFGVVQYIINSHNIIVKLQNAPGQTGCSGGYRFYCIDAERRDIYDPLYKVE